MRVFANCIIIHEAYGRHDCYCYIARVCQLASSGTSEVEVLYRPPLLPYAALNCAVLHIAESR